MGKGDTAKQLHQLHRTSALQHMPGAKRMSQVPQGGAWKGCREAAEQALGSCGLHRGYIKKKNPESPGKLPGLSRAAFARILAGTVIFQVTSLSLANMFLSLYQISFVFGRRKKNQNAHRESYVCLHTTHDADPACGTSCPPAISKCYRHTQPWPCQGWPPSRGWDGPGGQALALHSLLCLDSRPQGRSTWHIGSPSLSWVGVSTTIRKKKYHSGV